MISQELKELMEKAGGKYIVIEKDKPRYIVMSWEEYKKSLENYPSIESLTEEELIDRINSDIAAWRENQSDKTKELMTDEIEKLEDMEYVQ
jgi:hypothetical protein